MKLKSYKNLKAIKFFCVNSLIFFCLILVNFSYAQANLKNNYSDTFIKECIVEVFQNDVKRNKKVTKEEQFQMVKYFFNHQLEIKYLPNFIGKDVELLSSVYLIKPHFKHVLSYNPDTFNPLKYKFPLWNNSLLTYRIDSTNYYILIHPKPQE